MKNEPIRIINPTPITKDCKIEIENFCRENLISLFFSICQIVTRDFAKNDADFLVRLVASRLS